MQQLAWKAMQATIFVAVTGWFSAGGVQGYAPAVFGVIAALLATMTLLGLSALWRGLRAEFRANHERRLTRCRRAANQSRVSGSR